MAPSSVSHRSTRSKIFASSFSFAGKHSNAISIARWAPKGYEGRIYQQLAPSVAMLKIRDVIEFAATYQAEILARLDPATVYAELGDGAILLCWEDATRYYCHRRQLAEWLESALDIEIPELDHSRADLSPWQELPPRPPSTRWKSSTGPHKGSLFDPKA